MRLAARWNPKARHWIQGRRDWRRIYTGKLRDIHKPIWFHCASLGEFEQGRPVIEALRASRPDLPIVLTFYSPSGYEIRKNYNGTDAVLYLPLDTPANAHDFIEQLSPTVAIFVKYEHWLYLQSELDRRHIPRYLINARFRPDQVFFKPYGAVFREALGGFKRIFVQDDKSLTAALSLGLKSVEKAGDTRFDRVAQIVQDAPADEQFEAWEPKGPVLVLGSSWPWDESIVAQHWKGALIIVPHEVHEPRIAEIRRLFPDSQRYSSGGVFSARVIIVDTIGKLAMIYRYGDAAFIGGGFGKGIHNTLEAASWGLPVFFGPNYRKFTEAAELIAVQGGMSIEGPNDWQQLPDPGEWKAWGERASAYVRDRVGATPRIVSALLHEEE